MNHLKNKIIHIVLNDFVNDSRVIKSCNVAKELGLEVHVFALNSKDTLNEEFINGINIHRINLISKKLKNNKFVQLIKYIEFFIKVVNRINKFNNVKIIHINDLAPLPLGIFLKRINPSIKVVYDAHEHETEANGIYGLRKILSKKLEKSLIYRADRVLTVSNSIAEDYMKMYNIPKPDIILNAPFLIDRDEKKYDYFREKFHLNEDSIIFLYQGALIKGRGIEMVIEAFSNSKEDRHIVFMGKGSLTDYVKKKTAKYNNMHYLKAVEPSELLRYTQSADIGICIIEPICKSYEMCLPNKFFEYNMAGIPVIANDLIEVKPILKESDSGYIINNIDELKTIINEITKDEIELKANNTSKIRNEFNWNIESNKLSKIYSVLLKGSI